MKRVVFNPKILGGKPILQGTRMTVEFVLGLLASGLTAEDVVQEYPQLTKADIRAVLNYAAAVIKREEVISPIKAALA
ncbi:MAG: DUF433 domain-containing protein [Candidatus Omnitrophica bacterium]|nr:DUF433 domain-containing protein [Candidatus Omnitrophota bacterium]